MKSNYIVELRRIPRQLEFHVFRNEMNKRHDDTWHDDVCHVAPNRWTLNTWKAKCHILFMHELSGGKDVAWETHDMMIAMCQKDWEWCSSPNQNTFDRGMRKETGKREREEKEKKKRSGGT